MRFKLKSNLGGQFYFPKEIRDMWGHELELIPDLNCGAIYPSGISAREVLRSLKVVIADLEHRVEVAEAKAQTVPTKEIAS